MSYFIDIFLSLTYRIQYWAAVRDSCLEPDLEMLPHGDATEVGEKVKFIPNFITVALTLDDNIRGFRCPVVKNNA